MSILKGVNDLHLFDLIINQLDGLAIANKSGQYVYVNKKWRELFNMSFEDVKGKYVHDIVLNTRVDEVLSLGKEVTGIPTKIRRANGDELQVFCSYFPIYDNEELVGCFLFAFMRHMQEAMALLSKTTELMNELQETKNELEKYRETKYSISDIVGESPEIQQMKAAIHQTARSNSTVLIEGETGTGKELVAHSIHALSQRASNAFIKVNCAAIPSELLESEFFGYVGGAFTGSQKSGKKGKFELANEGTLFLDEINQLSLELQPKLLRAIQEKEIEKVGGETTISVNCRIIVATNVSLEDMVKNGLFREDLFYRLNVIKIKVPSLRERKSDIPLLADRLREKLNKEIGTKVPGITDEAKEYLMKSDWPGNIRQLQNTIERAMNMAWLETITLQNLEANFSGEKTYNEIPDSSIIDHRSIKEEKNSLEKEMIQQALLISGGNKTRAAKALGISRALLYRKLSKYGLN